MSQKSALYMPFSFHICSLFLSLETFSKKTTTNELSKYILQGAAPIGEQINNLFQTGILTKYKAFILTFCTDDHTHTGGRHSLKPLPTAITTSTYC